MNAMTSTLAAGVTITELAPTTRIALRLADPAGVRDAYRQNIDAFCQELRTSYLYRTNGRFKSER